MKIVGINGGPRKEWNTATLLKKALEGAKARGADTELVHLYDLSYQGCISCFACKKRGGESYGVCAVRDELTPLLKKAGEADALILGSPIYVGTVTGEMKSFMERLIFPYLTYTDPYGSLFPRKVRTGFIYTMNVTEEQMKERGFAAHIAVNERVFQMIFGAAHESLCSFDTYQFADYAAVVADGIKEDIKARRRREVFPKDCEKAFDLGGRFAVNEA